jgi:hypothetical protein
MTGIADRVSILLGPIGQFTGWQQSLLLSDPAAGIGWTHTVPGQVHERIVAVSCKLVTSGVAGNRGPHLVFTWVNGKTVADTGYTSEIPTGVTAQLTWHPFAGEVLNPNQGSAAGSMPDLLLPSGCTVSLVIDGEDAGDQVSDVTLIVQRFSTEVTSQFL